MRKRGVAQQCGVQDAVKDGVQDCRTGNVNVSHTKRTKRNVEHSSNREREQHPQCAVVRKRRMVFSAFSMLQRMAGFRTNEALWGMVIKLERKPTQPLSTAPQTVSAVCETVRSTTLLLVGSRRFRDEENEASSPAYWAIPCLCRASASRGPNPTCSNPRILGSSAHQTLPV
jgi:hypothetical protein